jgi:transcriptional regulator with XRE-family HTH domain
MILLSQMAISEAHDGREVAAEIGAKVRELRNARRLTQAQLAQALHVAQGRLSDLERGKASFTAEQFLTILRIFNVPASEFTPASGGVEAELQNALARLGARHLVEAEDLVPSERFREVHAVIREVLVDGSSPRMITALAPVLVEHADALNLAKLALELAPVGLERRLFWLAANAREALRRELKEKPTAARARKLRRADVLLAQLLDAPAARERKFANIDVLDKTARSEETVRDLTLEGSTISKRWNIATALQADDFYDALRQANGLV